MAHKPNYTMQNYDNIWSDIAPLVSSCDFSFANIESPVDNTLDYSTYPRFNMKKEYPEAAIKAGFNVFSLINNHSNDMNLRGIKNTMEWADKIEKQTKGSVREVFFHGLKSSEDEISYKVIKKNGWTILFCAITEILNEKNSISYLNYVEPNKRERETFKKHIQKIASETEHDIFILSLHAFLEEYVFDIPRATKNYYHELLDCGIDIIWANHPHIVLERELIGSKKTKQFSKIILHANGNTISSQRTHPDFQNPKNTRDYTGDGLLYKVTFQKNSLNAKPFIKKTESHYITTYITNAWTFVIKFLDSDFINYLKEIKRNDWAIYIQKRKSLMRKTPLTKTLK